MPCVCDQSNDQGKVNSRHACSVGCSEQKPNSSRLAKISTEKGTPIILFSGVENYWGKMKIKNTDEEYWKTFIAATLTQNKTNIGHDSNIIMPGAGAYRIVSAILQSTYTTTAFGLTCNSGTFEGVCSVILIPNKSMYDSVHMLSRLCRSERQKQHVTVQTQK